MYTIYDVGLFGTIILLLYIMIDFIKNRTKNLIKRVCLYSFIFYMLIVARLTIGSIVIPPFKDNMINIQLVPLYFIGDLYQMYQNTGLNWQFWNALKLTFFNFILLMPLGAYLVFLFKLQRKFKALLIISFVSLTIETMQLSFTYLGWITARGFNIDDLLINTLGGYIAFLLCKVVTRISFNKHLDNM